MPLFQSDERGRSEIGLFMMLIGYLVAVGTGVRVLGGRGVEVKVGVAVSVAVGMYVCISAKPESGSTSPYTKSVTFQKTSTEVCPMREL